MTAARKRKSSSTQSVTPGSNIRFESAKSDRKPRPNPAVVVVQEVNPVTGFVSFLKEYAVVGLAIGFIIGLQAQVVMRQLVTSFLDPAFHLMFGQALSQRTFTLEWHGRSSNFGWGLFIYGLLNFIFILAAIYIIVKFFKLDKLAKPKEDAKK